MSYRLVYSQLSRQGGGDAAGLTRTVPAVTHLLLFAADERAAVVVRLIASIVSLPF